MKSVNDQIHCIVRDRFHMERGTSIIISVCQNLFSHRLFAVAMSRILRTKSVNGRIYVAALLHLLNVGWWLISLLLLLNSINNLEYV